MQDSEALVRFSRPTRIEDIARGLQVPGHKVQAKSFSFFRIFGFMAESNQTKLLSSSLVLILALLTRNHRSTPTVYRAGLFHFVYGASPHQISLHLPIILLHFPIKFASFPQQIASSPQQVASFPQQIASFPQQNSHFPITILLHFAKTRTQFFDIFFLFFIYKNQSAISMSGCRPPYPPPNQLEWSQPDIPAIF